MGMLNTWINSVIKPKETFAAEKKNASIIAGLKNYFIIYLIIGILVGLAMFVFVSLMPAITGISMVPGLETLQVFGGVAVVLVVVLYILFGIIASFIFQGILWIIAKVLGGQGTFTGHYYLTSLYVVPMGILSIILNLIPLIGPLISFLVGLYALYLTTLALKEAHGYSIGRAVLTWLIPLVLFILIMVLGVIVLLASIMTTGP